MGILKKWSKRILTGLLAFVLVIGSMTITPKTAKAAIYADRGAYGVGEGKKIPDHIFAPFVDIVSYVSDKDYSSAGTLSLEKNGSGVFRDLSTIFPRSRAGVPWYLRYSRSEHRTIHTELFRQHLLPGQEYPSQGHGSRRGAADPYPASSCTVRIHSDAIPCVLPESTGGASLRACQAADTSAWFPS